MKKKAKKEKPKDLGGRPTVDRRRAKTIRLSEDVDDRLKAYCESEGQSQSDYINDMLDKSLP